MKKSKYLVFGVLCSIGFIGTVNAAPSYGLSVSSGSVENGKSVTATLTLKNTAAWNVKIVSAGNTSGCSQSFADATGDGGNTTKSLSVTCKATSIGLISFTVSGDATSSDGATVNISGSKSVNVVEPRKLSTNNYLKSLSVEGYEISPAFDDEVLEYSVTVPSTVNEITINAAKADSYAKLDGTGTFPVEEGNNTFDVTVTSETGVAKVYKVNVIVEDINPIIIKVDGKEYSIVKNSKNIEVPVLFEETKLTIDENEIPAYTNELTGFTLIPIRDGEGNVYFAIKNGDNYTLYRTITIGDLIIYIIDKELDNKFYETSTLSIGNYNINAYKNTNNSDFYLLYGKNMVTGEEAWYKYDNKENTIQRYDDDVEVCEETSKNYLIILIIFAVCLICSIILTIFAFVTSNKKVKKMIEIMNAKKNNVNKKDIKIPEETKEFKKTDIKKQDVDLLSDTIKVPDVKNNKKKK